MTHIVNLGLHTHPRALPDEAAVVAELGMTYIHIPVDFEAPTETDFNLFCAAMGDVREFRVHLHCIVNARVTAFLYRYARDHAGIDATAAQAMLESVWHPGGVWARFIGRPADAAPHRYAGRDYDPGTPAA